MTTSVNKVQLVAWGCFYFFLLLITRILLKYPYYEGDTEVLLTGVDAIKSCINKGIFLKCPGVVHFPLFQYIPSLLLNALGYSQQFTLRILALINSLSFFSSLILIYFFLKKVTTNWSAQTAILIMVSSPLLWYAKSTFNEMTAAFVTLAFTGVVLLQYPVWIITLFTFLSGITKEIALPFLLLIGILALFPKILKNPRQCKSQILGMVYGSVLALASTVTFNYFRFGSPSNTDLIQQTLIVNSATQRLISFLGIWLSPNGGILFFWFSWFICFFSILVAIIKLTIKRFRLTFYELPALTIIIILFALTFGFASWFAPFGWACWGPRLMLPWLPSLLLLLIYFYQKEMLALLKKVFKNKFFTLLFLFLFFFISLPQLIVLLYPEIFWLLFTSDDVYNEFPLITEPGYYGLLNHLMWTRRPPLFDSIGIILSQKSILMHGFVYFLALSGLIYLIQRSVSEKQKHSNLL
jgi:hypothetical protein